MWTLSAAERLPDWRRFSEGFPIPSEGYCDQPYMVTTRDGGWLCVMTTGKGREGDTGQHVVATRTSDLGKTWSPLVDIEPASGPEASWAMPVITPAGRVYVFYTYNRDNMRDSRSLVESSRRRVDTLGHYAYKYSDDGGRSWSAERFYIPMRPLRIEQKNPFGGEAPFFWGIGEPIVDRGDVFFGAAKIAYFGYGFMPEDRGVIFRSPNLLSETDPRKHRWIMLPEGDEGLGSVNGPVCDEHNLVALSDGSLYAMARTIEGHPVHYYSRDRGKTWTPPEYAAYTPGGRQFRHPRACPRLWKTSAGKFLFWFHNNGHRWYNQEEALGSRNIAWLSGGTERNGKIYWTQPEMVRYVDNTAEGCSYPDLVEHQGRYFITATQKTSARVGEIPAAFLEQLWDQPNRRTLTRDGLLAEFAAAELRPGGALSMPVLPDLERGGGFTLDFRLRMTYAEPGQILLDSRPGPQGPGILLTTGRRHTLELEISDGARRFRWDSDPMLVGPDAWHHASFMVDGGPKVISVVVDGLLCDGGPSDERKYGYGRFVQSLYPSRDPAAAVLKPEIGNVTGGPRLQVLTRVHPGTEFERLRLYSRALTTTEAIGNSRAAR
ncbi:MAG: hypothetical protein FJW34_22315 [Acidobacteria bacterium]|nr:hypothetical protein [Acidobacteriota bacterium]